MKSRPGPPMTLGIATAAQVRLIVWCKGCGHQVEPDPAEMAARYGAETPVLDWCERFGLLQMRRTAGRYGRDRDQAVIGADGSRRLILLRREIGLGNRSRGFQLREYRFQGMKSRRQRVAVLFDRPLEKGREGQLLVIGKVKRHDPVYMGASIWP